MGLRLVKARFAHGLDSDVLPLVKKLSSGNVGVRAFATNTYVRSFERRKLADRRGRSPEKPVFGGRLRPQKCALIPYYERSLYRSKSAWW